MKFGKQLEIFSTFFSMSAEAKAREYSKGACDYILVPATKVAKVVCLVFSMKLLVKALACLQFWVNTKFV